MHTTALFLLATSSICAAGVDEWSGRTQGTEWDIVFGNSITILAAGTFKFDAIDTNGDPNSIGNITVADGVTGTVTVYILRDPADSAGDVGAVNVDGIDLTNDQGASLTGNLARLEIEGHLGTSSTGVLVTAVTGNVVVGDSTSDDLQGDFDASAGGVNGSITIAGDILSGKTLNVGVMSGDLTVGRDVAGTITATSISGNVNLERALVGSVNLGNMIGNITVDFTWIGSLTATSLTGNITSSFGMGSAGTLTINSAYAGSYENTSGAVQGTIHLQSDLDGLIVLSGSSSDLNGGLIDIDGDITETGRVIVQDAIASGGQILVNGNVDQFDVTVQGSPDPYEVSSIEVGRVIDTGNTSPAT
jgi:hypothetical protein